MHKVNVPQYILDRACLSHGRATLFDSLDMSKTAHVIVDLQNGFVAPGAPIEVPVAREIIANVNAISAAVRKAGGVNAFLRYTSDPDEPQKWDVFFKNYMSPDRSAMQVETFRAGSEMHALYPELDVTDEDLIFDKTRFSGMIPGTCEMDDTLKARGIDTMIITGTLTNCCCESTARDAMQMGYNIIFVTDGNATLTDEEHNATLLSMGAIFADLKTSAEVVALAEAAEAADAVATAAE
ncbi:Peroxyureidoacrylate/ureidoacrylate amidohydrolase RutB (plasmid) [Paracoccaceae bacterium]|nr:Peroxyureidoacrylate/ureidoacrylate amidohydrolase RutB [Paracoccaceae bacterium]